VIAANDEAIHRSLDVASGQVIDPIELTAGGASTEIARVESERPYPAWQRRHLSAAGELAAAGSAGPWLTRSALAGVRHGTDVVVRVAGSPIGSRRIRADAGTGIARTGHMALVRGCANYRVRSKAQTRLAGVGLRTGVPVVARCSVRSVRIRAASRSRIARTRHVTLVGGRAGYRIRARARAALAGVGPRAGVVVIAGRAVRLRRIGTGARCRIAGACHVTLIRSGAGLRIGASANPGLTRIGLRAGVAVIARSVIRFRQIRASTCRRIANSHQVALIGCRADNWI
jgi:hypothetical protein